MYPSNSVQCGLQFPDVKVVVTAFPTKKAMMLKGPWFSRHAHSKFVCTQNLEKRAKSWKLWFFWCRFVVWSDLEWSFLRNRPAALCRKRIILLSSCFVLLGYVMAAFPNNSVTSTWCVAVQNCVPFLRFFGAVVSSQSTLARKYPNRSLCQREEVDLARALSNEPWSWVLSEQRWVGGREQLPFLKKKTTEGTWLVQVVSKTLEKSTTMRFPRSGSKHQKTSGPGFRWRAPLLGPQAWHVWGLPGTIFWWSTPLCSALLAC